MAELILSDKRIFVIYLNMNEVHSYLLLYKYTNFIHDEVKLCYVCKVTNSCNKQSKAPKFTKRLVPFLSITHNAVQMVVDIHNHIIVVSCEHSISHDQSFILCLCKILRFHS